MDVMASKQYYIEHNVGPLRSNTYPENACDRDAGVKRKYGNTKKDKIEMNIPMG